MASCDGIKKQLGYFKIRQKLFILKKECRNPWESCLEAGGSAKGKQEGRFPNQKQPAYINHIHDKNRNGMNPIRCHNQAGKSSGHRNSH